MPTRLSQKQAVKLLHKYVFSKSYIPFVFIAGGIFTFKLVYQFTHLISLLYFTSYSGLSITQRVEWNNRAMSTVHATFITATSLYLVFLSDLFSEDKFSSVFIFQSSLLSTFVLGVSIGYFIADLVMIFNFHPGLGGEIYVSSSLSLLNMVMHHFLSSTSLVYSMFSCQGQLYTYMVLISEITTPIVNLRWYLEIAGMKKRKVYLINGVVLFFAWLFARIFWFVYIFYHVYLHFDQVRMMHNLGIFLLIGVPAVLGLMNLVWFGKIYKGMMKTLSLCRHHV